jgi:hypothetical protein
MPDWGSCGGPGRLPGVIGLLDGPGGCAVFCAAGRIGGAIGCFGDGSGAGDRRLATAACCLAIICRSKSERPSSSSEAEGVGGRDSAGIRCGTAGFAAVLMDAPAPFPGCVDGSGGGDLMPGWEPGIRSGNVAGCGLNEGRDVDAVAGMSGVALWDGTGNLIGVGCGGCEAASLACCGS